MEAVESQDQAADLTEAEVLSKVQALGELADEQRNSIVCALIGHSRICTTFFGYQYCGRCSAQVGDTLGGVGRSDIVAVGHNCGICRANFAKCDWRDKLFAPDPFVVEEGEAP